MENRRVLVDTSIVIDYLRRQDRPDTKFVKIFKDNELCLSAISIFELYNGATTTNKNKILKLFAMIWKLLILI